MGVEPPGMDDTTGGPPSGAILLLHDDGDLRAWRARRGGGPARWPRLPDGSVLTLGGDLVTREEFGDFLLHVEFRCPRRPPLVPLPSQLRGNSGVYLHGRYEIQVLDSWGIGRPPGDRDCGALYRHAAPLVNACRAPGEWQCYDVRFRAPRFDAAGAMLEGARVTARQNGVLIHHDVELRRPTGGGLKNANAATGPLLLQDHLCPVRFRCIWVVPGL